MAEFHTARRALASRSRQIVTRAAEIRQGFDGPHAGERGPAGLAAGRVHLKTLRAAGGDGAQSLVTPLGYRTACRALPRTLARLDADDPRRRAADLIAHACERVSGAKVGDLAGGSIKGLVSDGGVTTNLKHVTRLRLAIAILNGWTKSRHGRFATGAPKVALAIQRRTDGRSEILLSNAVLALCRDGQDVRAILAAHGWSVQLDPERRLRAALLAGLDDVAEVMLGARFA